jgi:2-polyprenyl-3-methyl-5-hydroxy-6-metoxy-1,4-benzoquinol methylase
MISNAELRGGDSKYILADIDSFNSTEKYDVIHSMEVLYYLENPSEVIRKISNSWLNKNGRLIVNLNSLGNNEITDKENIRSSAEKLGINTAGMNSKEIKNAIIDELSNE